jgi:uncharacterized membrane protein
MKIFWPLHIVGVVVWLGGLFWLCVARPKLEPDASAEMRSFWHGYLSRFFATASAAMVAIIASGVALVRLKFGGLAHMPPIHRANMAIGLPAIGLYAFVVAVLWRRFRAQVAQEDSARVAKTATQIKWVLTLVTVLGVAAAVLSAIGRYA